MTDYLEGIEQREQRQDALADQLRDLAPIANRLGMYDAADFLEEILDTDRVQHYGMTRTVCVGKDEKISDRLAAENVLGRGGRGEREGHLSQDDDQ